MQKNWTIKLSYKKILFTLLYGFISFLICIAVLKLLGPHVIYKFKAYLVMYEGIRIFEIWKLAIFYIVTWLTCSNKNNVFFYFFSLMILAILVGDSRINMLGYFGFLYFANFKDRNFMYIIFPFILYFFFKSCYYIYSRYYFGGMFG